MFQLVGAIAAVAACIPIAWSPSIPAPDPETPVEYDVFLDGGLYQSTAEPESLVCFLEESRQYEVHVVGWTDAGISSAPSESLLFFPGDLTAGGRVTCPEITCPEITCPEDTCPEITCPKVKSCGRQK